MNEESAMRWSALRMNLLLSSVMFMTSCGMLPSADAVVRSPRDPPVDCLVEQMKFTEGYIPSPLCNR